MLQIDELKAEAMSLRKQQAQRGRPIRHSEALELVAKKHGFSSWRSCCALLSGTEVVESSLEKSTDGVQQMERYADAEWKYALEIPKRWNRFPPIPSNSPFEVTRFMSHEDGFHLLIIFRQPFDPSKPIETHSARVQESLTKAGFGNFLAAEVTLRNRKTRTLQFEKSQEAGIWTCRQYFIPVETLCFTLGFGTNRPVDRFELFDQIAGSFDLLHSD